MSYYPHHVLLHAMVEEIIVTRDAMGFVTHIGKVITYRISHMPGYRVTSWRMQLQRVPLPTKTLGIKATSKVVSHTLGAIPQRPEFWLMNKVSRLVGYPRPRPCGDVHGAGIGLASPLMGKPPAGCCGTLPGIHEALATVQKTHT